MTENRPRRKLKLHLAAFPERYSLPARPSGAPPSVQDSHRQTAFLLESDLSVFERSMNLQLQIVAANARLRTAPGGAVLSLWSRVFSHLSDACTLMFGGSYVSCPPLLRTACDCIAAQRSLIADGFAEYEAWLGQAVCQDREHAAMAFDLGRYRAGSVLAQHERLGALYRLLTDLSMPHFGSTALLTAPDSSLQKLSLAFGDNTFHLGWAELVAGWLLEISAVQLETVVSSGVVPVDRAVSGEASALAREAASALDNPRRCRAEETGGRYLFRNFRRRASGAPRRVLL